MHPRTYMTAWRRTDRMQKRKDAFIAAKMENLNIEKEKEENANAT